MSEDFVNQCCDKAVGCIFSGDLDTAAKYLKKVTDRDPGNSRALELLEILASKKRAEPESTCI